MRYNQARIWRFLNNFSNDWHFKNKLAEQLDSLDDGYRILSLIESDYESNQSKIEWLVNDMANTHYVLSVCFGDPESGKSAFNNFLMQALKEKTGWTSLYYDTFKKPDFCDKLVYSLDELSNYSFVHFDELGKVFPAREFASVENLAMTSATIDLRHQDLKFIGGVQKARLVDINYLAASNYKFFKYITPDNLLMDREQVVTPFVRLFLPTLNDFMFRKSRTLCVTPTRIFYADFPLPDFYTHDFSKNLANIPEDLLKRYCSAKLRDKKDIERVRKMVKIRFKKVFPVSWFEQLL